MVPVPGDVAVIVAVLLIASPRLGDIGRGSEERGVRGLTDRGTGLLGDAEVVDIAEAAHLSGGVRDP
jgi:hypothetical protein